METSSSLVARSVLIPLAFASLCATPAQARHPAVERAERAAESGWTTPERDLRPLIETLEASTSVDVRRELISALVEFGASDASTPSAVKSFLRHVSQAPLLDIAKNGHDPFLQGDALHALRSLAVPVAVLEEAAAIAEADPNAYVQSRGEILRNFMRSLPAEDLTATRGQRDPERAGAAIAYLDRRHIPVATQSLRDAAQRADSESVAALLDAGVAADAGSVDTEETPIYLAVAIGCHSQGADTDWLMETVSHLITAGADVQRMDGNQNNLLHHAAHYCGPRMAQLLAASGVDPNRKNGSGISALAMAMIFSKLDVAAVLGEHGGRLDASQRAMVESLPATPELKALIVELSRVEVEKSPG